MYRITSDEAEILNTHDAALTSLSLSLSLSQSNEQQLYTKVPMSSIQSVVCSVKVSILPPSFEQQ
jgi:hypothetical protein